MCVPVVCCSFVYICWVGEGCLLGKDEYTDYCKRFFMLWEYLKSCSKNQNEVVRDICMLRKYSVERIGEVLKKADFQYIDMSKVDLERVRKYGDDLALFSEEGYFLMTGRYVFPVKDMLGNVVALIGWYPDEKKYVTTPSKLFSKDGLFYGMEQLGESGLGSNYIITEGIFDSLSARSLGIKCVAQMGITSSRYKEVLYTLFKQIVAIPDIDEQGRDVLQYDKWKLPRNGKYFRWSNPKYYMKDLDKFINSYEEEDVREVLRAVFSENQRIVTLKL